MCDEITDAENDIWLKRRSLNRRELAALGAGASLAMMLPASATGADQRAMSAGMVAIPMAEGTADAFFVHPAEGRHPAVILWPDIGGLREAYQLMGTRLAQAGYAVLVVNQYYRSAKAPVFASLAERQSEQGQARLKPMVAAITPAGTSADAASFADWLDRQPAVDSERKMGSAGYCMGGPFTFRTAAARPERVGAIASLHGGKLVTDAPDSPHLLLPRMQARLLIAIAQNDDAREPATKDVLRRAAQDAGRTAEIEVYPAQHGWCTIDSAVYDKDAAEKAWGRMLHLFKAAL